MGKPNGVLANRMRPNMNHSDESHPAHKNCWIFVRTRPRFEPLIAKARQDWAAHNAGQLPIVGY